MIQWRAVIVGATAGLTVAVAGWLALGFVTGVPVIGFSGVVAGGLTGLATDMTVDDDWRAGGYYGMLAAGLVGMGLVAAAAAIAVLQESVVTGAVSGPAATVASVIASPLGVPLFVLEGIMGGATATWIRTVLESHDTP